MSHREWIRHDYRRGGASTCAQRQSNTKQQSRTRMREVSHCSATRPSALIVAIESGSEAVCRFPHEGHRHSVEPAVTRMTSRVPYKWAIALISAGTAI